MSWKRTEHHFESMARKGRKHHGGNENHRHKKHQNDNNTGGGEGGKTGGHGKPWHHNHNSPNKNKHHHNSPHQHDQWRSNSHPYKKKYDDNNDHRGGKGKWKGKPNNDGGWKNPSKPWHDKSSDIFTPPHSKKRKYEDSFSGERNHYDNDNKGHRGKKHRRHEEEEEEEDHTLPPVSKEVLASIAYTATLRFLDPDRHFTDVDAAAAGYPPPWFGIHANMRDNKDEDEHSGPPTTRLTIRIVRDLMDELYWQRDQRERVMRESTNPAEWWKDYNWWYRVEGHCRLNEKPQYVKKDHMFDIVHNIAKLETLKYNENVQWLREEGPFGGRNRMDLTEDRWEACTDIYPKLLEPSEDSSTAGLDALGPEPMDVDGELMDLDKPKRSKEAKPSRFNNSSKWNQSQPLQHKMLTKALNDYIKVASSEGDEID